MLFLVASFAMVPLESIRYNAQTVSHTSAAFPTGPAQLHINSVGGITGTTNIPATVAFTPGMQTPIQPHLPTEPAAGVIIPASAVEPVDAQRPLSLKGAAGPTTVLISNLHEKVTEEDLKVSFTSL